ncbi:MAG TPA: Ig-like domain-containing protein [Polyangia bacterium]|nr:Ig-like domain-containing protein [Polyangia bacterium]
MRWWVAAGCASVAAVVGTEAHAQAPRYEVQALQESGQCTQFEGTSLDAEGRVVGFNEGMCGADPTGRVWVVGSPDGGMALPPLPGAVSGCGHDARDNGTYARDVSNGRITGAAVTYDCDSSFNFRPIVWENGGTPRLLPLPAGWTEGEGLAINAVGDVMGRLRAPTERIALWPSDGPPLVIGPTVAQGRDLNGNRQVVGCGRVGTGPLAPFVWQNGQITFLPPSNWNNQVGCANALNEGGLIVGNSDGRPVYWQGGSLKRLAPANIAGDIVDVNDTGRMIGTLGGRFFYSDGSNVWDLVSLIDDETSWLPALRRVIEVNNQGQILAHRDRQPFGEGPFPTLVLLTPKPAGPVPSVAIVSPWNGEPLSDLVTIKAAASAGAGGLAGVTFYQDGKAVGPEDTTQPYSIEVDLTGTGPTSFHARVRDLAGTFGSSSLRFATVSNTCQSVITAQTISGSIGTQTGAFTVRWTAIPRANPMEGGFALSQGTPGGFSGTAAAVLFAADGQILVRNGGAYQATGVSYTKDVSHHLRMAVDVAAGRYSVWLKLANQPERQLAANVAFRNAATQLDHWIARVDESSSPDAQLTICNARVP